MHCIVRHSPPTAYAPTTTPHLNEPLRRARQRPALPIHGLGLATKWLCSATELLRDSGSVIRSPIRNPKSEIRISSSLPSIWTLDFGRFDVSLFTLYARAQNQRTLSALSYNLPLDLLKNPTNRAPDARTLNRAVRPTRLAGRVADVSGDGRGPARWCPRRRRLQSF